MINSTYTGRNRLLNLLDGLLAGVSHRFEFYATGDWTGYEVECLLQDYGILLYGREINQGFSGVTFAFKVPIVQARWAEVILLCVKLPICTDFYDEGNRSNPWLTDPNRESVRPAGGWGGRQSTRMGKMMHIGAILLGIKPGDHNHHHIRKLRKGEMRKLREAYD